MSCLLRVPSEAQYSVIIIPDNLLMTMLPSLWKVGKLGRIACDQHGRASAFSYLPVRPLRRWHATAPPLDSRRTPSFIDRGVLIAEGVSTDDQLEGTLVGHPAGNPCSVLFVLLTDSKPMAICTRWRRRTRAFETLALGAAQLCSWPGFVHTRLRRQASAQHNSPDGVRRHSLRLRWPSSAFNTFMYAASSHINPSWIPAHLFGSIFTVSVSSPGAVSIAFRVVSRPG